MKTIKTFRFLAVLSLTGAWLEALLYETAKVVWDAHRVASLALSLITALVLSILSLKEELR